MAHELAGRGLAVERLDLLRLSSGSREREAALYHSFMGWLLQVEKLLEQEQRTVLLIFDEFEKLERAEEHGRLQLELLLDWFRSIMQHHPRLALLFSGVGTLGEFSTRWAGHLVNVQTLRVSFLRPDEARRLIMRPTPDFPGEHIFGIEVVAEILRITACHPFLVQAVCSTLIGHLNVARRTQASSSDLASAVQQVIENWGGTYFHELWQHSSQEEQTCLLLLNTLEEADVDTLATKSGLSAYPPACPAPANALSDISP